jgi:hypothetical protein
MEYVGQVPAPPLDRFIDDIYCLTGVPRHRRMNVPPMPSAHLFVNLGGPVRLWDSDPSVPPAVFTDGWFMGVWTRRFLFEYPNRVRLVGVHCKPWGISPFIDMPATELRDRFSSLSEDPNGIAPARREPAIIGVGYEPIVPGRWSLTDMAEAHERSRCRLSKKGGRQWMTKQPAARAIPKHCRNRRVPTR